MDPQADLKEMKKNIIKGVESLSSKYEKVAIWIKQKDSFEPFVNTELMAKDELGQTLVPDDITCEDGYRFLACKATGNGNCLFNAASRILVGNESLCHFLRLLTTIELYTNSNFYANHPAFQEYLSSDVVNGYDEVTVFTMCLESKGMDSWDGEDRINAINEDAKQCCEENSWCGMFHVMALSTILGRPVFSVYPNVESRTRVFLHRKLNPRVVEQSTHDTVYIMWSRDSTLDSSAGAWFQPNHFIPIVKAPFVLPTSRIPTASGGKKAESKRPPATITNFFPKIDKSSHQPFKTQNTKRDSKSTETKNVDDNKFNCSDSVKPECKSGTTKVTSRNLTCATVERWKHVDLAQHEAVSWLTYESEKTSKGYYCSALKCKVCIMFESVVKNRPKFSRAFIDGSTNFRITSVLDHCKSDFHNIALSLYHKHKNQPPSASNCNADKNQPKLDFSLNPQQIEDLKRKFDISYFTVKEELPLSKYEKIIALEKRHGVSHDSVYSNRTAATEFISFQAKEVLEKLTEDVAQARFYSIMFDGTTDNTVIEQEAVFVLYFDPAPAKPLTGENSGPMVKVKTGLLSIEDLESSDAQGVLHGIKQSLQNLKLQQDETLHPVPIGLGGDGCSTNRGTNNGVQALFKLQYPWVIFSWCVAHRLELALKDALNTTYFKEVDEVLLRLYYLYEKSPKKLRGLYELHLAYKETFEFLENSVKPKRSSGTRWISHKLAALKILVDKFGIFIQHLETLSCDKSVKSADQAKFKGYVKKWKSGKLFVYCCFFIDLLQPAATLSLAFQSDDVDVVAVSSAINTAKKQLDHIQEKEVHQLKTLKHYMDKVEKEEYQGVKLLGFTDATKHLNENAKLYVDLLKNAMEDRLGGSSFITSISCILNCEAWDNRSSENEIMDEVILHNLSHFQEPLKQQGLKVSQLEVIDEWHDMLDYSTNYLSLSSQHYRSTWYKIFQSSSASKWQNILLLIRLFFTLPVSNAIVERMFNCLGRVKTPKRASLSQETLEDILRIQTEGPPLESYNPTVALEGWERAKRRRPNQKQRKDYKKRSSQRVQLKELSSDDDLSPA